MEKHLGVNSLSPVTIPVPNTVCPKVDQDNPKRMRRKPQARADFVDINEALSNFAAEEVISTFKIVIFIMCYY